MVVIPLKLVRSCNAQGSHGFRPRRLTGASDSRDARHASQRRQHPTLPVWHEWADGGFSISIWAQDIKAKNLARDPQATIIVAENELPYRGIEVSGKATVEALPDLMPLVRRLAQRYMGKEAGLAYAETFADDALGLIRLTPGTVRAWDFRDDHEETR